ncbi:unnamed protein product [Dovyalis caffra]|uniref:Uncharacterized protein n=1 Tax=Dovyalis caffra TaxID=77055 RepID=A0AAV1QSB3_9ROSI|nr:unnamed protein product [Dovyalis caffra]
MSITHRRLVRTEGQCPPNLSGPTSEATVKGRIGRKDAIVRDSRFPVGPIQAIERDTRQLGTADSESRSVGFEPTTSGFGDPRSTELN